MMSMRYIQYIAVIGVAGAAICADPVRGHAGQAAQAQREGDAHGRIILAQGSTGGQIGRRAPPVSGEVKSPASESSRPARTRRQSAPDRSSAPRQRAQPRLRVPSGRYSSTSGGMTFSCSASGSCTANYLGTGDGQPAKVVGRISSSGVLTGTWVEVHSASRCSTAKFGSPYWGVVRFAFNADRTSWSGSWGYCGPGSSNWSGSK
jgi:hypothetical protein